MVDITTEVNQIEKAIERELLAAFKNRTVSTPGTESLSKDDLKGIGEGYDRLEEHADLENDMRKRMAQFADK